jgi:asparagine synthetase B (glutamine-hydrolysing)
VFQGQTFSHTFAPDIDSFAPEIDYAKTASDLFNTKHTFVPVPMVDYPNWLTTTIRILGQPPHHESTACYPPLFDYIEKHNPKIKYLFSAQGADALFGMGIAQNIARTTRYHLWPPFLLYLLGVALRPISQSESYHTRLTAGVLRQLKENQDSPQHLLNAQSAYTDWEMVYRNFSQAEVREALAYRRQQEIDFLNSSQITEKTQTVDLLSESYDTAGINYQLSLAYNEQTVYPFLDDALISAAFKFDVRERYFSDGRTKPILKQILEMGPAASITKAPKRGGGFRADLFNWMWNGILRDSVSSINRPDFMSLGDFQRIIASPGWYTWNLLTFDLFEKTVVSSIAR